jgi:transposase
MFKQSEDFKQEAVRIALTSGLPCERVAANLGIGQSALGKWLSQQRPSDLVAAPQADLAREYERLRLKNRILKEEKRLDGCAVATLVTIAAVPSKHCG